MDTVGFNQGTICIVDSLNIAELINNALKNGRNKYRLCLHSDDQCMLHESIIVTTKDDHSHFIHKHMDTSEFNMIIRGRLLVIIFDDDGGIRQTFILESGKKLLFRIEKDLYHLAVPLTDIVVFLETKQGPFSRDKNILPEWDSGNISEYVQKALQIIENEKVGNGNDIL